MSKFPKVVYTCDRCGGSGEEDVSYHGSPIYRPCATCDGKENVKYYREMYDCEKIDFLLDEITKMKKKKRLKR